MSEPIDLHHHGDAEVAPGLVDLAVNVRHAPPPPWLAEPIAAALTGLSAYPDGSSATAAIAARHRRDPGEVLLTAGAAQGFVLLAQALRGVRRPVVVHPQFTEPEAALAQAGHRVERVLLRAEDGFRLDPGLIPRDADLVVIGNPTNPTSVLHPAAAIAALARPGRVVVVDEAFADTTWRPGVVGEPESLAERRDLPGVVVVRSLTKTWGLAGLRIGYLLGPAGLLDQFRAVQPLWPVSTPALAAAEACASPVAVAAEREIAQELTTNRAYAVRALLGASAPAPLPAQILECCGVHVGAALQDPGVQHEEGAGLAGAGSGGASGGGASGGGADGAGGGGATAPARLPAQILEGCGAHMGAALHDPDVQRGEGAGLAVAGGGGAGSGGVGGGSADRTGGGGAGAGGGLGVAGVTMVGVPESAFLLIRIVGADKVRVRLRERGFVVRRGDTFPGLGPDWLRIAVRDPATTDAFVTALRGVLEDGVLEDGVRGDGVREDGVMRDGAPTGPGPAGSGSYDPDHNTD